MKEALKCFICQEEIKDADITSGAVEMLEVKTPIGGKKVFSHLHHSGVKEEVKIQTK